MDRDIKTHQILILKVSKISLDSRYFSKKWEISNSKKAEKEKKSEEEEEKKNPNPKEIFK